MSNKEKIVIEIYKEHYDMHRRGAYDFPSLDVWCRERLQKFKDNYPELMDIDIIECDATEADLF